MSNKLNNNALKIDNDVTKPINVLSFGRNSKYNRNILIIIGKIKNIKKLF